MGDQELGRGKVREAPLPQEGALTVSSYATIVVNSIKEAAVFLMPVQTLRLRRNVAYHIWRKPRAGFSNGAVTSLM